MNNTHLTPFNKRNALLWFDMAEAQFETIEGGADDRLRYHLVVRALPDDVVDQMANTIRQRTGYATLKEKLINKYSKSKEERFTQLTRSEQLGSELPSEFLERFQALAIDLPGANKHTVAQVWLNGLPPNMRQILDAFEEKDIEALARKADKMYLRQPKGNVSEVKHASKELVTREALQGLLEGVTSSIRLELDNLKREWQSEKRRNERKENFVRTNNKHAPTPKLTIIEADPRGYCYYHARFSEQARCCVKPCSYSKN